MDTLSIKGMLFHGTHGVAEHEKIYGNDFEVDVILHSDLSKAANSDDIADAIDYARIHEISGDVILGKSVDLIEKLAFNIGNKIAEEFSGIEKFEVRVKKLNPPVNHRTKYTEARMVWPR